MILTDTVVAERDRARYWAKKTGRYRPPYVPIGPVRDRIALLQAAGLSTITIGLAADVPHSSIRSIMLDPQRTRVGAATAARIMALRMRESEFPPEALIPALASQRRLRALARLGWTTSAIGVRIGFSLSELAKIRLGTRKTIRADIAAAIHRAFDELRIEPAPKDSFAVRVRNLAIREGWPRPIDWDGYAMDDPAASPMPEPARGRRAASTTAELEESA